MAYKIGVIGTGYVGLVTGACLADVGNDILCIDVNEAKLERLRNGDSVIYERDLDKLLERNIREKRLTFSTDITEAVLTCPVLMFCLPTPPGKDGAADLAAVMSVAEQVATLLVKHDIRETKIVANKSTVPVGTTKRVAEVFAKHAPGREVHVVSNPEFLSEGYAVEDFMKPERVIIGTNSDYARQIMVDLYSPFTRSGAPVYCFDIESAEVAKYAANAMLATKISFMNALSEYCEVVGANIDEVRLGMGADNRIGRRFLFAGIGYGGSCFPKDVKAIIHSAKERGLRLEIAEATEQVNNYQMQRFAQRILNHFEGNVRGKVFAMWGLAFKPNTDDVRDAPALSVINSLLEHGAEFRVYDPEALESTRAVLGNAVTYATDMYDALVGASALVIATEWNEFRNPSFEQVVERLNVPLIFDGRNLYPINEMVSRGIEYHSIGRPSVYLDDADACR